MDSPSPTAHYLVSSHFNTLLAGHQEPVVSLRISSANHLLARSKYSLANGLWRLFGNCQTLFVLFFEFSERIYYGSAKGLDIQQQDGI